MPRIYIINPGTSAPSYHTAEFLSDESGGWVQIADLAITTVAAFVPAGWDIRLGEEAVAPIDLKADVDFVAITGKVSQRARMFELAAEFRCRGRTVLIGGPFASLTPEDVRPHCDILVTGEMEDIAAGLFADLESGTWKDLYEGDKVDLRSSPIPRWDLYPVDRAVMGAVQTTRGCPFNCEFCDVIQYQGRKQRHKSVEQVIAELDALYGVGFRHIFIVDDNFTVHRGWARTILDALTAWNAERADDPVTFSTQTSMDIARDPDLLSRCRAAGLRTLFLGVETVNEDSLRETNKKQNLLLPIADVLKMVMAHGIGVQAGIIVGFDNDDPGIFRRLEEFFESSAVAEFDIGVLSAPRATDLYRRLEREGRLLGDNWEAIASYPLQTNIIPKRMTREQLVDGIAQLCRSTYSADRYEKRMLAMIEALDSDEPVARPARPDGRSANRGRLFFNLMKKLAALGPDEKLMVSRVLRAAGRKPGTLTTVMHFLSRYGQARYVLDRIAETPAAIAS